MKLPGLSSYLLVKPHTLKAAEERPTSKSVESPHLNGNNIMSEHFNLVNTYPHMYISHDKPQQQYQQVSKLLKESCGEIQHLQKKLILTRLRP